MQKTKIWGKNQRFKHVFSLEGVLTESIACKLFLPY